jgi:hypothetical protein
MAAPVSMSRVYRVWALAREQSLTPEQVAEWLGHGVDVLAPAPRLAEGTRKVGHQ